MGTAVVWTAAIVNASLRRTIGDPAGPTVTRWSNTDLDDYFNRAALQVCLDAETAIETAWQATLVVAQREYAAPQNFFKAESVRFLASTVADRSDIRELEYIPFPVYRNRIMRDEVEQGEPVAYTIWRKLGSDPNSATMPTSLYMIPTPDAASAAAHGGTDNLEIFGYKYPDQIDSTGLPLRTVELEPHMIDAAIFYAASLVFEDDGEVARARGLLDRYEMQVPKIRSALVDKDRSDVSMIVRKGARKGFRRSIAPFRW